MGRRISILLVLIIVLGMSFNSEGKEVQEAKKINVDAWLHTVKIIYREEDITGQLSPVVINGTAYLPVGNSANFFNKDVLWNPLNKTITLSDRSVDYKYLEQEKKIKKLEDTIARLENKLEKVNIDIDDLEDTLNDKLHDNNFGRLDNISNRRLDIDIRGDEDDFSFYIEIDLDDYRRRWNRLEEDDIEDFICDIYDYIKNEFVRFKDSEITGYFYDTDENEKLVKCYESNGKLRCRHY